MATQEIEEEEPKTHARMYAHAHACIRAHTSAEYYAEQMPAFDSFVAEVQNPTNPEPSCTHLSKHARTHERQANTHLLDSKHSEQMLVFDAIVEDVCLYTPHPLLLLRVHLCIQISPAPQYCAGDVLNAEKH